MRRALTLSAALLIAASAVADVRVEVVASSARELQLEIRCTGEELTSTELGYLRIRLAGAPAGALPGLPALPAFARWLALPPTGVPRLHIEAIEVEALARGTVEPSPTPILWRSDDIDGPQLQERIELGSNYASFRHEISDAIQLGEITSMARQRIVPLRIAPILFDAGSGELRIVRRARVRIEFPGGAQQQGMEPGAGSPALGSLLNGEQARLWRGLPASIVAEAERLRSRVPALSAVKRADGIVPFVPSDLESEEVRLRVSSTGLWQLRLSDLIDDAEIGFPTDIPRSHLRLYEKRSSLPGDANYPDPLTLDVPFDLLNFTLAIDTGQPIDTNDILVFHGQAPRDLRARDVGGSIWPLPMEQRTDNYNSGTVYCLAFVDPGAGSWQRIGHASLSAATVGGTPQPWFAVRDRFEEDGAYQDNPYDEMQPRYQWADNRLNMLDARARLRVARPGTSLNVGFTLTRAPATGDPRLVDVSLRQGDCGGVPCTNILLDTIDVNPPAYDVLVRHDVSIAADPLEPGFVDLHLERTASPNSSLRTYLGDIELSYDALYQTVTNDDALSFDTGQSGGDVDLELSGFTRNDLLLYELTNEHAPLAIDLAPGNLPADGANFRLSLRVPQAVGEKRRFAVQTLGRIPRLRSGNFDLDPVADTIADTGPAQVLAIGSEDFRTATETWLDWRRQRDAHGWVYRFIDVQQIYDQFSGGMKDPGAIKEFLYHYFLLYDLRGVLLVGDGNENAREIGAGAVRDIVPPSVHSGSYDRYELLASDKWFVLYDVIDDGYDILADYPNRVNKGPDVLIGRLPANDVAQLTSLISKVTAYETPAASDDWRSRALFVADDAYSTGLIGTGAAGCYKIAPGEVEFANSQGGSAATTSAALDGVVQAELWDITPNANAIRVLDPDSGAGCYNLAATRSLAESTLAPFFYDKLSQGWLWVSYQGHANWNILAHEALLTIEGARASIANTNRPFVFFGMGCHVTDFLRAREGTEGRTVGEELLMLGGRGAIATYGSSGYEFLFPNAAFMELITQNFFAAARDSSTVLGRTEFDTPWILAEALAESERDMVAVQPNSSFRQMVAQYNLLGDPLLRLDAQAPRLAATVGGAPTQPGSDLIPPAGQRSLSFGLDIVDETTLASLRVLDVSADANLNDGISAAETLRDHTPQLVFDSPADLRQRHVDLNLPIVAQDYQVVVEAYDAAYRDRRPSRVVFAVPMPLRVFRDDQEMQPGAPLVGIGLDVTLRVEFTSPIVLTEPEIDISFRDASLSSADLNSADGRAWVFTANLAGTGEDQELRLDLAGVVTTRSYAPTAGAGALVLKSHLPYPNPTPGPLHILCETNATVDEVQLWVYDLSGRPVYEQKLNVGGETQFALPWDGRDLEGDALANGVYLYRLRAKGVTGEVRSGMGRIVFMR